MDLDTLLSRIFTIIEFQGDRNHLTTQLAGFISIRFMDLLSPYITPDQMSQLANSADSPESTSQLLHQFVEKELIEEKLEQATRNVIDQFLTEIRPRLSPAQNQQIAELLP